MSRSAVALALAAVLAAVPVPAPAQEAGPELSPLARAREQGVGATVLVEGIVSVPPGLFDGGFAIQDQTAGIWVLPLSNPVRLRVGQRVRVQGTLDEPNGQLVLQPVAVRALGARMPPAPRALRTGSLGERQEGSLVQVRGRVVGPPQDDAPWGWKVMLDDGSGPVLVFVDAETNVDAARFRAGETVEVTGFASQYDDHYEIVPRDQIDVLPIPPDQAQTANARRNR